MGGFKNEIFQGYLSARARRNRLSDAFITFYISAQNALHASNVARRMGGVKHSKLPIACVEIPIEEYLKNRVTNAYERAFAKKKKNIFELES